MKQHIGVKLINATPMTLGDYNALRGWHMPSDESPEAPGHLVEYLGGGKPNCEGFDNYVSWSPADVFERAYRPTDGMPFGMALEALRMGKRVARAGWNGKGMWLVLDPGTSAVRPRPGSPYHKAGLKDVVDINAHIDMMTATGEMQPGWLASQTDMLADDWMIVE